MSYLKPKLSPLKYFHLFLQKFKADCFSDTPELEPGWYRRACTHPIWRDLNKKCPEYKWKNEWNEWKWKTCGGDWGGVQMPLSGAQCGGVYDCFDRNDEEGCEEIPPTNLISSETFTCG